MPRMLVRVQTLVGHRGGDSVQAIRFLPSRWSSLLRFFAAEVDGFLLMAAVSNKSAEAGAHFIRSRLCCGLLPSSAWPPHLAPSPWWQALAVDHLFESLSMPDLRNEIHNWQCWSILTRAPDLIRSLASFPPVASNKASLHPDCKLPNALPGVLASYWKPNLKRVNGGGGCELAAGMSQKDVKRLHAATVTSAHPG